MADSRNEQTSDNNKRIIQALQAENAILKEHNLRLQKTVISLKDERIELKANCTCTGMTKTSVDKQPKTISDSPNPMGSASNRYKLFIFLSVNFCITENNFCFAC